MKVYGGHEVRLYSFLTLAVDAVEWSISRLDCFTARKELRYRLNRRMRGRQSRWQISEKIKVFRSLTSYESATSYQVSEGAAAFVVTNLKKKQTGL